MDKVAPSILYVEDNPGDVFLLRTAFAEFGFTATVTVAADGETALRRLEEYASGAVQPPDLVLMDLNLPCLGGFELLQHVREDDRLELPVVVLTSSREQVDRDRCVALGCAAYLEKPSGYDGYRGLVQAITDVLAQPARPQASGG